MGITLNGSSTMVIIYYNGDMILVGSWSTPLKNMTSSVGIMKFPKYGKITNVPNHQPAMENGWKCPKNHPK